MPPAGPTTHQIGRLSATQVAEITRIAGFPDKEIPMAVEIARLESGFDPNKIGILDHDDLGLFQLNRRFHPEVDQINWRDPQANASLAYQIWQHGGWSQWTSYNKALLTINLSDSRAAAASAKATQQQAEAIRSAVTGPFGPLIDIANFLKVGRNWGRIGQIIIGGAIVLIAVNALTRPYTEPVRKVAKTAAVAAAPEAGWLAAWK